MVSSIFPQSWWRKWVFLFYIIKSICKPLDKLNTILKNLTNVPYARNDRLWIFKFQNTYLAYEGDPFKYPYWHFEQATMIIKKVNIVGFFQGH